MHFIVNYSSSRPQSALQATLSSAVGVLIIVISKLWITMIDFELALYTQETIDLSQSEITCPIHHGSCRLSRTLTGNGPAYPMTESRERVLKASTEYSH